MSTPVKAKLHIGRRFWPLILIIAATFAGLGGWLGFGSGKSEDYTVKSDRLLIPLTALNDNQAHFYLWKDNGKEISFFVVKDSRGTVRAAFDACDVCYREKKGYGQKDALMVCKNCNQTFPIDKVGDVSGGCNPSPLVFRSNGGQVEILFSDLRTGQRYF